jgi:hypothetical protein
VPSDAAPCVIALDLARIATRPPGPVALDAFISHGLRQVSKRAPKAIAVFAVAQATTNAGLAPQFPELTDSDADFLPVLRAVHTGEGSEIAITQARDAAAIAKQTYYEILLQTYDF